MTAFTSGRTAIVDVLRGWALLSVVLVNFANFYTFNRVQRIPADDVSWHVGIALLLFVTQVLFSRWWLARLPLGPVERVWRTLSHTSTRE